MKKNTFKIFFGCICLLSFLVTGNASELTSTLTNGIKICEWTNNMEFYYSSDAGMFSKKKEFSHNLNPRVVLFYSSTAKSYEVVFETIKGDTYGKSGNGYDIKIFRKTLKVQEQTNGLLIGNKEIKDFNNNVTDKLGQLSDEELISYLSKYECPPYAYTVILGHEVAYQANPFFTKDKYAKNDSEFENTATNFYYSTSTSRGTFVEKQKIIDSNKTFDLLELVNGNELDYVVENYIKTNINVDMTKSFDENVFCKNMSNTSFDSNYYNNSITSILKNKIVTSYLNSSVDPNSIPDKFLKTGVFNRFSTVAENLEELKGQCEELLKREELTDEEISNIEETMDDNISDTKAALEKYASIMASDNYDLDWGKGDEEDCTGFLGSLEDNTSPAYYLDLIMDLMRYGAIILVFVLSVIDFIKAVTVQDKDQLKKASVTAVKRLIAAIVIFFLPILINFILSFVGAYNTCEL